MTISAVAVFFFAASTVAKSIEEDVAAKARAIKPGRKVEVTLVTGEKVIGKLGSVQGDQIVVGTRTFPASDLKKIKPKMTRGEKWAVGLAIYGAIVGVVALTLGG
ncbi:hypothetical protein F183_A00200 [Bryobacterales bacterium F-183]|nr:hypothetical protein F183_A00200 [Bryobacterales bacterium F-183]